MPHHTPLIATLAAALVLAAAVNIATARAIVIAIPQILEAGEIAKHARESNPGIAVLARAHADADVDHLLECGADVAFMGEREIARSMCDSVEALTRYLGKLDSVQVS